MLDITVQKKHQIVQHMTQIKLLTQLNLRKVKNLLVHVYDLT